jgi:hypothetical protein
MVMENKNSKHDKDRKYNYFVDGEKFEADDSTITGALIKLKLPESKRSYQLYLEGHGNEPNELVNDNTIVSLDKGAKHFISVPPATFGKL